MKLSVVIPAYNEEKSLAKTVNNLIKVISKDIVDYEILIINDNSTDNTLKVLEDLAKIHKCVRYETNNGPNGFGYAVRYGLERFSGDCVAIMMADLSDSPKDLLRFYSIIKETNVDCVFGNRWGKDGEVVDYPIKKKIINRIANTIISVVMNIKYRDTTNAFKLYKKEVIEGVKPFLSPHFNLTIELPLKAIIRGYSFKIVPNKWTNRIYGESNLKIREMGSRYFFILMYCFIEKYFSKGDFKKKW